MMTEYQRIEEQDRKFRKLMRRLLLVSMLLYLLVCAVIVYLLNNPLPY